MSDDYKRCSRCRELKPRADFYSKKDGKDASPSIDRIIPTLGYVRGNVIVVSLKANRIKNDATPDELMEVARFYKELLNGPRTNAH